MSPGRSRASTYDEKLGNFGLVGGGAAGTELDIVDTMLGSPPHTLVVATSAGRHTEGYLLVMEDYGFNQQGLDGTQHPRVRSDIAYHETPNGGGVLCVLVDRVLRLAALEQRRQQHLEAGRQRAQPLHEGWPAAAAAGRCRSCIAGVRITTSR